MRSKAQWTKRWYAWAGDRESLIHLTQTLSELAPPPITELERKRDRLTTSTVTSDDARELPYHDQDGYAAEMIATARQLSFVCRGEPEKVMKAVEGLHIKSLTMVIPRSLVAPNRTVIEMSVEAGCTARIEGDTPSWTVAARDRLISEIKPAVPLWAWLRSSLSIALYGLLSLGPILSWVFLHGIVSIEGSNHQPGIGDYTKTALGLIVPSAIVGLAAGWVLRELARRIIPGLQVVSSGDRPRAGRALGFIVGVILASSLGILVSALTQG